MKIIETIEVAGRIASDSESYGNYYNKNFEIGGSPKGYDLERIFSNPQNNASEIAALSKYYYAKVGIIMRVVNIIRDFSSGNYTLNYPTDNDQARQIVDEFIARVDLKQVVRDIVYELALTGNCAGYNRGGKRIDIYPITRIEVSPLIIGNNPVLMYLNPVGELFDTSDGLTPAMQRKLGMSYPKEILQGIKKGLDKIPLNTDNAFFLKTNSSRYEPYGVTFLLPAFDELAHKTVLKEAERSTATGIIEKVLKISVGDKDHKPKQAEIDFYNSLIKGKKGSLKITVPYFVDFEYIEPSTDILGEEKFLQVDKDLLSALGISLSLIRGEGGGNYSEGIISVSGLIKTIESICDGIPAIVGGWFRRELETNGVGIEHTPCFTLDEIQIDKAAKLDMLKWLFTSAGLPYEVLYKESGYDYASVKLKRIAENAQSDEDVFRLRAMPFQGNQAGEGGRPEKNLSERKTDKGASNNNAPRPSRAR